MAEETNSGYGLLSRYRGELMGLATLGIMLLHTYQLQLTSLPLRAIRQMGFAGVDVFLLLSGMGICLSLHRRAGEPLGQYYRRRCRRLLPAFWLVVGLYSAGLALAGRIPPSVILWNLSTLSYWWNIPGGFNWYISAIAALYLLAPFYDRLFRRCRRKEWLTLAVYLMSYGLYRLTWSAGLFHLMHFLLRVPDFAMGFLLASYLEEGRQLNGRHLALWGGAAACGVAVLCLYVRQPVAAPLCLAVTLALVPACLVLGKLLDWLPWRGLHACLRTVGGSSLEIYLLNVIITREFDLLAPWLDHDPYHITYYLIAYPINLVLGILLHRGLERLQKGVRRA